MPRGQNKRREPETAFHIAVARFLDRALPERFFHTAIPAGGGGRIRGALWKARGYKAGMPDHVVFAGASTGQSGTLWLELKSKTGTCSPAQKALHKTLWGLGHWVFTVKTLDEVEAILADFCGPGTLRATCLRKRFPVGPVQEGYK